MNFWMHNKGMSEPAYILIRVYMYLYMDIYVSPYKFLCKEYREL